MNKEKAMVQRVYRVHVAAIHTAAGTVSRCCRLFCLHTRSSPKLCTVAADSSHMNANRPHLQYLALTASRWVQKNSLAVHALKQRDRNEATGCKVFEIFPLAALTLKLRLDFRGITVFFPPRFGTEV